MTAIRALIGSAAEPFFAVPVPHELQGRARAWFAEHAQLAVMVLLPGEALFTEADTADRFTAHLGAAWEVAEG